MNINEQRFTPANLLRIARAMALQLDRSDLNNWRRSIIPPPDKDGAYSSDMAVRILVLAWLAPRSDSLVAAARVAGVLADGVQQALTTLGDLMGPEFARGPVWAVTLDGTGLSVREIDPTWSVRQLAHAMTTRGPLVFGVADFAAEFYGRTSDVLSDPVVRPATQL